MTRRIPPPDVPEGGVPPQPGTTRYAIQVVLAVEQYDGAGRLVDAKQSQPMTVSVLSADALREVWGAALDQLLGAIRGG